MFWNFAVHDYRILEFINFYKLALNLTKEHCATFNQGALRHQQHEDVTPWKTLISYMLRPIPFHPSMNFS